MLACIYNNDGKFELVEKPVPKAKENTAVIKVMAESICGTDFRTFMHGTQKIAPGTTIGHEVCGVITELGSGVQGFAMGDTVALTPALGCGECYMCQKGHTNMCDNLKTLGYQYDGGFAQYMEIPAAYFTQNHVNKVPDGVSCVEAALAEPIACAINAQEFLNIQKGDYVAVFGSGFIGCMHAELAFAAGAEKVIMIEPNEVRRETAKRFVPRIEMLGGGLSLFDDVMKLTGGRGVDVAIVACSVGSAQEDAQKIIAKRGRISLFGGLPGEGRGFVDSNLIHYKEVGVFGVHASTADQNRKALALIRDGKIEVKKYVTEYPLQEVMKAFEEIRDTGLMKAVIIPNEQ